ncbi:hypothetical protein MGWOODY_Tha1940 [hydrothermal vent metagenome]|uniref:Uncharacterized protein n=1 Tax=hydrothermal vent metagenome TaxID=652676 RepID=A0A160TDY6_9ZZZZ
MPMLAAAAAPIISHTNTAIEAWSALKQHSADKKIALQPIIRKRVDAGFPDLTCFQ